MPDVIPIGLALDPDETDDEAADPADPVDDDTVETLLRAIEVVAEALVHYTPAVLATSPDMAIDASDVDKVILGARDLAIVAGFEFQRDAFLALRSWTFNAFGGL